MNDKAIFIDVDGTLRDDNKNISERTIKAITNLTQKGYLIVLCSGRGQKYTELLSQKCGASKYIITSSGAAIYDYIDQKQLFMNVLDKTTIIELYNVAKKFNLRFSMNVGDCIVTTKLKYFDGSEKELNEPIEEFAEKNNVFQCNIADKDFEKMKNAIPYIEKVKNCEIKNRHKSLIDDSYEKLGDIYCDVANVGVNKGIAIEKFCDILGIKIEETIAIGDDINDIPMFEKVGYSVVMGNASNEIKKYADKITLSNNNDGVAVFLESLI